MKTIEQRAEDFAHIYSEKDRHFAEECYVHGATDQRKIDIDKACEWLKANNGKRFNGFDIVYTQGFITEFRKAMEELTKIDL